MQNVICQTTTERKLWSCTIPNWWKKTIERQQRKGKHAKLTISISDHTGWCKLIFEINCLENPDPHSPFHDVTIWRRYFLVQVPTKHSPYVEKGIQIPRDQSWYSAWYTTCTETQHNIPHVQTQHDIPHVQRLSMIYHMYSENWHDIPKWVECEGDDDIVLTRMMGDIHRRCVRYVIIFHFLVLNKV